MAIRIVFVITDLHLGGSPRMLRDLAIGLKRFGGGGEFEPMVVSLKPLPAEVASIVHDLRAAEVPVASLNLNSMAQLPLGVVRLAGMLNEIRPEFLFSILIHANALATLTLPFLKVRPKSVQSLHTLQERPRWHWTLQGILSPFADAMVAPSRPILDRIAAYGPVTRPVVIANGIDVDRFAQAKPFAAEELPWPAGSRVIGYVGRFDRVKNLPLLIRAFARIAENSSGKCHLALVGYGPEQAALERLARAFGIASLVHFPGPTRTPERWYKSFSCHCLPSTVEGFGLTLVEAMAAGIPVVAIRTAVTESIVRDTIDGLLVDRPDAFLLAKAMQRVMDDSQIAPPHPISLSKAPQTAFGYAKEHFSLDRMVELHAEFFKNF